jgi:hypothetical protein
LFGNLAGIESGPGRLSASITEVIMTCISTFHALGNKRVSAVAIIATSLAVAGSVALAAQNRSTLKVPNGLAFSEIKGYEDWQDVAVSQTEMGLKVIVANKAMIDAYRKGIPDNGKPFPDGSKIVKIEWTQKKNPESPYFVMVPDALKSISFIVKDSRKFKDTGGWGYAQFQNDAASDTLKPFGTDAACGYTCHTAVKAKDYMFTAYPRR